MSMGIDQPPTPTVLNLSDIIKNQPIRSIGCIGHVSHGKSTVVKHITGIKTQKHAKERERNITINLGYANVKYFKCLETNEIFSAPSNIISMSHPETGNPLQLVAHISCVDAPGHSSYMATMLSGTAAMDQALLVIAANDKVCPQIQTYEHLIAVSQVPVSEIAILQNKLDLVTADQCSDNLNAITEFVNGSIAEDAPIIPISAQLGINMNAVSKYIVESGNRIDQDLNELINEPARLTIIRSFDVNKTGIPVNKLKGGVIGGTLESGYLRVGDYIEIRPGFVKKNAESGEIEYTPIISKIESLFSEKNALEIAVPGGLIAIGLSIDPTFSKANTLVGNIAGLVGTVPDAIVDFTITFNKIKRMGDEKISKLSRGESIIVCSNASTVTAKVCKKSSSSEEAEGSRSSKSLKLQATRPICVEVGSKVAIMKMHNGKNLLYGWGIVQTVGKSLKSNLTDNYDDYMCWDREPISIINDMGGADSDCDDINYDELLQNITFKENSKARVSLKLPIVETKGKITLFVNYKEFCKSISYEGNDGDDADYGTKLSHEDLLTTFIMDELSTTCNVLDDGSAKIKGRFKQRNIEIILQKYVKNRVLCAQCKSKKTVVYKKNRLNVHKCLECGSERSQ